MVLNMDQPEDDFVILKREFCAKFRTFRNENDILHDSLLIFAKNIDSPRVQNSIKTLEELMQILENRDELSATNVSILKEWANVMKWAYGQSLVDQYEKLEGLRSKEQRCNVCDSQIQHNLQLPVDCPPEKAASKEKIISADDISNDTDDAFDKIAPHLGKAWKDLARKFKISEYDIQDIERNGRLVDCAYSMFRMWKEQAGRRATVASLMQALGKCRRKDLVDLLADGDDDS